MPSFIIGKPLLLLKRFKAVAVARQPISLAASNSVFSISIKLPCRSRVIETAIVPFTQAHALHAADFIPLTKRYGLSLGDRACLGLATARNLATLAADIASSEIEGIDVKVIQIR